MFTNHHHRGVALAAAAATAVLAGTAIGSGSSRDDLDISGVSTANQRAAGYAPATKLAGGLQQIVWAQGSTALENPAGITGWYGYQNDAPSPDNAALPQMLPTATSPIEAKKTEPDKNTYLVFRRGSHGADPGYDYGDHFVYQGHESGVGGQSYITRINLDADASHRVTLLATTDIQGRPLATIDGSEWDPFAQRLVYTTENASAPTYAATAEYPSQVEDVSGALGRGGYEGVRTDNDGNIWIVEDIGGPTKPGSTAAKMPNSFVYRYVPRRPGDLHNGKLQVLQVQSSGGQPITFESEATFPSPDQQALHAYGTSFTTRWVTIHDTAANGNAPYNANTLAKAAHGTPFKRPENGEFRPGSDFREFVFAETGDTNDTSSENGDPATGAGGAGGYGSLFRLVQSDPSAAGGRLSLVYRGTRTTNSLDNLTFVSRDLLLALEDAGETMHQQRNALDSGWLLDVSKDFASGAQPVRLLAEGRDASATVDAGNGGFGKNDQDNELTGSYASDGDTSVNGLLGTRMPHLFDGTCRLFYTQQHGDNATYEIVPAQRGGDN
jgi:hypothetical protein